MSAVRIDVAPRTGNETIVYPKPQPETAACIERKLRAVVVKPFAGGPVTVERTMTIIKMSDWHP